MSQDQINAVLVERGTAGREVVRLKGGDPFVFGRGGEEAEACIAAGVPFEVVPGITSAIAAAAYAGIPVTHRRVSTSFTVVTGHEDPTKGGNDTNWDALAKAGGTLVILMGAGRISDIAKALVAGGRDESTPVAAVRFGTRPDQHTVRATLGTIADAGVESPSAIVVGDVAALDFSWFERRPLFGRTVVVTRAREQASELRNRFELLGATVLELPTIEITPLDFTMPELSHFAWLIFTSVNGVDAFFDRGLVPLGLDARAFWPPSGSPPSVPEPRRPWRGAGCTPTSCPNGSSRNRWSKRHLGREDCRRGCRRKHRSAARPARSKRSRGAWRSNRAASFIAARSRVGHWKRCELGRSGIGLHVGLGELPRAVFAPSCPT